MPEQDGTFGNVTDEDRQWYREHLPNKLVRAAALHNHAEMGWRKMQGEISAADPFGISKAKRGSKTSMSVLLSLEQTGAAALVAVCDEVGGFEMPDPGESFETPWGRSCDIYLNGQPIGRADRLSTESVNPNPRNNSVQGGDREGEMITEVEVAPGETVRLPEPVSKSWYEGKIKLESEIPPFGDDDVPRVGEPGDLSFSVPVKNKLVPLNVDEINPGNPRHATTYKCRERPAGPPRYNCVNWARILPREEAEEEFKLGQVRKDLLLV
jgi:hypothetical protein